MQMTDTLKIAYIDLGCPIDVAEPEQLLTQLLNDGYDIVDDYDNAALVLVNISAYLNQSVAESLNAIADSISEKIKVIVMGDLGINEPVYLHPNVIMANLSNNDNPSLLSQIYQYLPKPLPNLATKSDDDSENKKVISSPQIVKLTPPHYAYLKIADGANPSCLLNLPPNLLKQPLSLSRPIDEILAEAERLANAGVQEIMLVSQNMSMYGTDFENRRSKDQPVKSRLTELCKALSSFNMWTRMHYAYPTDIDEILPLMADGLVLPYLDMPLQHANKDILGAMKHPACKENMIQRIDAWRNIVPDISIRATFTIGFPDETETQFQELLDFLSEARLDRISTANYPDGIDTNQLKNQIPEAIKKERLARLMNLQTAITAEKLADQIGSIQPVMIDDLIIDEEVQNIALGRTVHDAPNIDGIVQVEDIHGAVPGQIVHVEIIDSTDNDLIAIPA